MNIKQAKDEIRHTVQAYLTKDALGDYAIPVVRQRPILLIGPPGIGKTAIMSQVARECGVALVSYTITHHTRQSAIGLPFIEKKNFGGKEYSITEYTMSEIVASIYEKMEATGLKEGILFIDEINCVSETLAPTMLQFLQGKTFGNHQIPEGWVIVTAGNPPEYNQSVRESTLSPLTVSNGSMWKKIIRFGRSMLMRTISTVRFCLIWISRKRIFIRLRQRWMAKRLLRPVVGRICPG